MITTINHIIPYCGQAVHNIMMTRLQQ